jgi:tetratricopeptide (TPR) repeat protein
LYRIEQHVLSIVLLISGSTICPAQENKSSPDASTARLLPIQKDEGISQTFTSEEGRFKISLPGNPKGEFQTFEIGSQRMDAYMFTWPTAFGQYQVKYADFPVAFNEPSLIKYTLDGVRKRLVSKGDVRLLSETDISLDGYTGREFKVATPNGLFIGRALLVGKRLYQLIAFIQADKQSQEASVIEILDSFKLITPVREPSPLWREAIEELIEAARAYRAGRFAEAQKHSERALELNPANKTAPFYIARSTHAQYRPGDAAPENIEKARAAIIAYQRILASDPNNEEAYKAIAFLLGDIKEDKKQRAWILRRATSESVPKDKRAEAYTALASRDWKCSDDITELPENKLVTNGKGEAITRYRRPKAQADFVTAWQCAVSGLDNIERAIGLAPDDDVAWNYKGHLLFEMAKLAEMNGQHAEQLKYRRQADEAWARDKELKEEKEKRKP